MAMVKIMLSELKYTNLPSSLDSGQTMKSTPFRDWAFWRRSGTCQKNQCRVAPSAIPQQLFGVSLTNICDKDNLPFPILVGLSLVFFFTFLRRGTLERQSVLMQTYPQMEKSLDSPWLWLRSFASVIWFTYWRVIWPIQQNNVLPIPLVSTETHVGLFRSVKMDSVCMNHLHILLLSSWTHSSLRSPSTEST